MSELTPALGASARTRHIYRTPAGVARAVVEVDEDGTRRLLRPDDPDAATASEVAPDAMTSRVGLYRASEVEQTIERGAWIFVCRDETEADAVMDAGLTATVLAPSPLLQAGRELAEVADTRPLKQARVVVCLDPGVTGDERERVLAGVALTCAVVRLERPLRAMVADPDGVREVRAAVMRAVPVAQGGKGSWPDPTPLTEPAATPPPFPVAALPSWVAAQVEAVAGQLEVDPAMPAAFALGALTSVVAPRCRVQVSAGWREGTNLYTVVGAASGEKKSPVFAAMMRPIEDLEAERQKAARSELLAAETRFALAERSVRDAEQALAAASKQGASDTEVGAELESALEHREQARDELRSPPRLLVDDSSPEALTRILHEQRGSITIASSEGLLFDLLGGRVYAGNGGVNLDVYLKGYSGDTLRVDRGGLKRSTTDISATAVVRDPRLSVAIATQPEPLLRAFTDPELDSRGITHRFLPVMPPSQVGSRTGRPAATDPGVAVLYGDALRKLAGRFLDLEEPVVLEATDDAYEVWHAWWSEIEPRRAPGGDLAHLTPWLAKAEAAVWRLAGLITVADDPGAAPTHVGAEAVTRAVTLINCFLGHRQALAVMGAISPVVAGAQHVLAWLRSSGTTVFSRRDAYAAPANRATFPHAEAVDGPLALLTETGWIRAVPVRTGGPGRPPSPKWEVHPSLHGQNLARS